MTDGWNTQGRRRIVLWRHGRTEWNDVNRFQGNCDVPLDSVGRAQAAAAAPALARLQPDLIVSSDLRRATVTAEALAVELDMPVRTDDALRETDGGAWQGLTRDEITAANADLFGRWVSGQDVRPPGGEARSEVVARVVASVQRHLRDVPPGGTLVVVSHGGAIRGAIGGLLGLAQEQWPSLGVISNCAWGVLSEVWLAEAGGPSRVRWRLEEYNAQSAPVPALGADDA